MRLPTKVNLAEKRFAWLLRQRGFQFVDESRLEGQIEVKGKQPDYYVWMETLSFLVEVEALVEEGPFRGTSGVGTGAVDDLIKRLRTPVQHAARQLEPYRDLNIPMLVVLDNHRKVGVPTGFRELIQLFGTLEVRVSMDRSGRRVGNPRWHHGGGRTLSPDWRTYVSGVAVILPKRGFAYEEPPEKERPMRVRLLHNPFAKVPFPTEAFHDPEDE